MLLLFLLIIGEVFYIQVIDYKKLNQYASGLWSRNLPIEANRGKIFDRNGVVLADNLTTSIMLKIIEDKLDIEKIVVMVQKK